MTGMPRLSSFLLPPDYVRSLCSPVQSCTLPLISVHSPVHYIFLRTACYRFSWQMPLLLYTSQTLFTPVSRTSESARSHGSYPSPRRTPDRCDPAAVLTQPHPPAHVPVPEHSPHQQKPAVSDRNQIILPVLLHLVLRGIRKIPLPCLRQFRKSVSFNVNDSVYSISCGTPIAVVSPITEISHGSFSSGIETSSSLLLPPHCNRSHPLPSCNHNTGCSTQWWHIFCHLHRKRRR